MHARALRYYCRRFSDSSFQCWYTSSPLVCSGVRPPCICGVRCVRVLHFATYNFGLYTVSVLSFQITVVYCALFTDTTTTVGMHPDDRQPTGGGNLQEHSLWHTRMSAMCFFLEIYGLHEFSPKVVQTKSYLIHHIYGRKGIFLLGLTGNRTKTLSRDYE